MSASERVEATQTGRLRAKKRPAAMPEIRRACASRRNDSRPGSLRIKYPVRIISRASSAALQAPQSALNRPDQTAICSGASAANPFIIQPHTASRKVGSAKGSRTASNAIVGGPGNARQLIVAR